LRIETDEEPIQEYVDTDPAAGRPSPVSGKGPVSSVPKRPEKAYLKYFRRRVLLIAILFITVISSLAWFYVSSNSIDRQTTAALDKIYANGRPLESRITGLKYAPFAITRGEKEEVNSDPLRLTERDLLDAVIKDRSVENLHAQGRFYLAKGKFEDAIGQLEEAKKLLPDNARILSDLGTAYLEKSRTIPDEQGGQQLKMRAMALEEFEKAAESDPKMPEAVFNRSICRQLLALPFQTRQSWKDYLDLDPSSKWAEEARRRLAQVETVTSEDKKSDALLQDFMDAYRARDDEKAYRTVSRNREMITGKLIPQRLAKLVTETGGDEKAEYLSALEYIGKLENERSGDPFFLELAKFYSSAPNEKLAALRRAQEAVFRGYHLAKDNNYVEALKEFQAAQGAFKSTGDDWDAGICGYWIGYLLNRRDRIPESDIVLKSLIESGPKYKWLSSQCLNWLSFNRGAGRQFSEALKNIESSLALAEETADLYLIQKNLTQRFDYYRFLGQYIKALDSTSRVLLLYQIPESSRRQKWRDLDAAADLFSAMENYRTAATFEKEALTLTIEDLGERTYEYRSNIKLGQIYGAQKKYGEALAFIENGMRITETLSDEKLKTINTANAELRRAHILRETGNCEEALKNYDSSIAFYERGNFIVNQFEAHKGRLGCYLKNGNDAAVQDELPVILALFRDYRTKIIEEQNRNSFFNNEQDVYDSAIDYEFGRQNYEDAFNYSEESRSRSLLDMQNSPVEIVRTDSYPEIKFPATVTEPLKLSQLISEIPAGVQVIQYSVLKDKTLIWLITREGFSVTPNTVTEAVLHEKVTNYVKMITGHNADNAEKTAAAAKELYTLLLDPVKDKLAPDKEICIIPDKVLFRLPFSTLISPFSSKYFLTEYTFVSAPSLNIFVNSSRKALEYSGKTEENLISIGNPSFNASNFPDLLSIESAATEAKKIREFYGTKFSVLTGKDALKKKVVEAMRTADVMHFGGHYIVNERSPLLSGFVLSDDPHTHAREDSILANYEILGDKLANTKKLIVLAACETGMETYYDGEGMIGAARTFLATDVPLVVASQWAVDTESTAELMVRFHKYRKTGNLSTAQALRRAQLDMLEGNVTLYRDPYYWAGFVTFGGYAQF
jgi:CHAT domain-containing protein